MYTNEKMFKDIVDMYEEVKNPKDSLTKKLLEEAVIAWEESDRLGTPDEKADPCVNHFIKKYPLLAANCPYIFKVSLLKERYIDLDLVNKALLLEHAINVTKEISKDKAEIEFGKEMAKTYFPAEVYDEVEKQMDDPEVVAEMRRRAEEASETQTVRMTNDSADNTMEMR